tara:strand:+ start:66700 stop:67638 length:939 start_codon:yes stop_codon:yes gene_type:complete
MKQVVKGIHHVTGIAGSTLKTIDFYTRILGLRLVKKTVHLDDPSIYQFYFGNTFGDPGTLLSLIPWGTFFSKTFNLNSAAQIAFTIPSSAFQFWLQRFEKEHVIHDKPSSRFKEKFIAFKDPDGLTLELVANNQDERTSVITEDISKTNGIRGIFSCTLICNDYVPISKVLTNILGYKKVCQHKNRYRYTTDTKSSAAIIDLVQMPTSKIVSNTFGGIQHIAFEVQSEHELFEIKMALDAIGLHPTPIIDSVYFKSIYFNIGENFLFKIATHTPGFTVDELLGDLGTNLKLPEIYKNSRFFVERILPPLNFT